MTDKRIMDQIAVIDARLKRLGERYKAARNDRQLGNRILAEIAELIKIKQKLMSAATKKPPGVVGGTGALTRPAQRRVALVEKGGGAGRG